MTDRKQGLAAWLEDHKPAAGPGTHKLLAAMMWSFVGCGLFLAGLMNMPGIPEPTALSVVAAAVVIGVFKGRFALDRTAGRVIARIDGREGARCIGGFLSFKSWALVLLMIVLGRALRASPLPPLLVWSLYVAVGSALLFSSRIFWIAWKNQRSGDTPGKSEAT